MGKEAISDSLLNAPRCPYETPSPNKTKDSYEQGHGHDVEGIPEQPGGRNATNGEIVHCPLDDPGNDQLKEVNHQQREKPENNDGPLLSKVAFNETI